ncbi:ABC transporter substrate-binding protein [Streptomyces acidicola]|uniref:ABC transporter substrate-binding protein n=1 Tax=Streptomyces acidicola TaxID=2596892 RepID=UPI0037F51AE0
MSTVFVSASLLALTACSGGDADDGEKQADPKAGGYPRTITQAMGKTTIDSKPKTVAALDSSYVDAAVALGIKVVAATRYPAASEQLPDYLPAEDKKFAADAKIVGEQDSPDVEKLYDAKPDVIVSAKIRHEKIYDELSNVAPTIFSESTGLTWKDNIRLLGKAFDKEKVAEDKINAYEERAAKIGAAIKEKHGADTSVSLARFTEGESTVRLYSSASFPGTVFSDAGLQRAKGQPDVKDSIKIDLSQEEISKLDADRIFVATYADPRENKENPKKRFQANPLWGALKGETTDVDDTSWITSVSLQGANVILDDLAEQFGVDPARS